MTRHWLAPKALGLAAEYATDCRLHVRAAAICEEVGGVTNLRRAKEHRDKALRAGRTACVIQELVALVEALTKEAAA